MYNYDYRLMPTLCFHRMFNVILIHAYLESFAWILEPCWNMTHQTSEPPLFLSQDNELFLGIVADPTFEGIICLWKFRTDNHLVLTNVCLAMPYSRTHACLVMHYRAHMCTCGLSFSLCKLCCVSQWV
uniref:Uncharacterized protein n=1 Tax=Arundo donax TaxID=35708 RepID=A0A0A9HFQ1_ARUDO